MTEKLRNLSDANTVLKGLARVAVTVRVGDNTLQVRQLLSQISEPTTNGVLRKRTIQLAAWKQRPFRTLCNQSSRHLDHLRVEVDHTGHTCLLPSCVLLEDPYPQFEVNVCGGDAGHFRWAAPRQVQGSKELAEVAIRHCGEDFGSLLGSDYAGAATGRRLLDVPQWVGCENALFVSPVEGTLECDHSIPLASFP